MPKYITITKAAKLLGVTPLTLRNWDKQKRFVSYRHPINNYRLYKLEELELFIRNLEKSRNKNLKVKFLKDIE